METSHQPALPYDYAQAKMPIQITTQTQPIPPATNSPQTPTPTPESTTPEIPPFPFDPYYYYYYYYYYHPGMSIYNQDQSYDPSTHAEKTSGAQAPLDSDHYRRGSFARTPVASPTHAPHPTTKPIHNPSHHHIIHPQTSTIPSHHRPNPGPPGDLPDTVMKAAVVTPRPLPHHQPNPVTPGGSQSPPSSLYPQEVPPTWRTRRSTSCAPRSCAPQQMGTVLRAALAVS
ncbi:extensin isoform X2 [Salmo salar]|uniref:Extensin isoform X2 n=1 Tax=Salmo salar TaxID=8030 RepID=A0ABM3EJ74_SALSA|nr:extensin-like isoform X2 [Salmo salar]